MIFINVVYSNNHVIKWPCSEISSGILNPNIDDSMYSEKEKKTKKEVNRYFFNITKIPLKNSDF